MNSPGIKTRHVVVELLPTRLDIVVFEGDKRIDGRRVQIGESADGADGLRALRRLLPDLKESVGALKATGLRATVLYRNATQVIDLVGIAEQTDGQAVDSALLGLVDALPYAAGDASCDGACIGHDGARKDRRVQVLVAADRDDFCEALSELVTAAGLRFHRALPIEAVLLARVTQSVLRTRSGPATVARLYIGEHSSFFVATHESQLKFARPISLGLESLVNALTRPIRASGANGTHGGSSTSETIELTSDHARRILHQHGLPARDAVINAEPRILGSQVLPLLQPVLQRFIVELRQSLRFGLTDMQRQGLCIQLAGAGRTIVGLPALFSEELGCELQAESAASMFDPFMPGSCDGELHDAMRTLKGLGSMNLLPQQLAEKRQTSAMRKWLWTGAAASLALVGFDAARLNAKLADARTQSEAIAARTAGVEALQETGKKLTEAISAMSTLQASIDREIGVQFSHTAAMKELAQVVKPPIQLTSIDVQKLDERSVVRISGYCLDDGTAGSRARLSALIDTLRASPLFAEVNLGSVQVGSVGERTGQSFDAVLQGVAVSQPPIIAAAESGAITP